MCRLLEVLHQRVLRLAGAAAVGPSVQGHRAGLRRSDTFHAASKGIYGAPKIHAPRGRSDGEGLWEYLLSGDRREEADLVVWTAREPWSR